MTEPLSVLERVEIPQASIYLLSQNIIHVHFRKNVVLDIPLQLELRKQFQLINRNATCFVYSADEGFILTKEARENAKVLEQHEPTKRIAMIVDNLAYRLIANFYVRVVQPKNDCRLFGSVNEALTWLRKQPA